LKAVHAAAIYGSFLAEYSQYYIYGRYIARWRVLCGPATAMLLLMAPSPSVTHTHTHTHTHTEQRHAKEEAEKKKWPEKVATRFTLIHSSFPRSIQQVTGTVYEELPSAFVKREEKQKQRNRHKNSL